MAIATALNTGNPGEDIPVLLPNGKIKTFTAGNVVNTGKVQVHGNYVYGGASPRTQIRDRDIFQKKTTQEKPVACQLVAASVWRGSALFRTTNLGTLPPYQVAPYESRVYRPVWESWDLVGATCVARLDGSGEYTTEAACQAAYTGGGSGYITEFSFKAFRSGLDPGFLNVQTFDNYGNLPTQDRYISMPSGNLAVNDRGTLGLDTYGLSDRRLLIYSSPSLPGDIWYRIVLTDGSIVTRSLFDGSIVKEVNGVASPLTSGDVTSLGNGFYGRNLPPSEVWTIGLNSNLSVGVTSNSVVTQEGSVTASVGYYRGVIFQYLEHVGIKSYFIKVHDPDLPALRVLDYPVGLVDFYPIRPYFIFLGTKAYFIAKLGRVRDPNAATEQDRPYFKIQVIKLSITNSAIVVDTETDFFYPNSVTINDPDLILDPRVTSYLENPPNSGDTCIDDEEYFLKQKNNRYREVNYHKSPNNKGTIVQKVPGQLYPGED